MNQSENEVETCRVTCASAGKHATDAKRVKRCKCGKMRLSHVQASIGWALFLIDLMNSVFAVIG